MLASSFSGFFNHYLAAEEFRCQFLSNCMFTSLLKACTRYHLVQTTKQYDYDPSCFFYHDTIKQKNGSDLLVIFNRLILRR